MRTGRKIGAALLSALAVCCSISGATVLRGSANVSSNRKNTADLIRAYKYAEESTEEDGLFVETGAELGGGLKGVGVTKASDSVRHWYYSLDGVFYGDSAIEYVFTHKNSMMEGVSFVYESADGDRLLTVAVLPYEYEDVTANFVGGVYSEKDRGTASEYDVHTLKADGEKTTVRLTSDFDNGVSNKGNLTAFTALGEGFLPKFGEKQSIALSFEESALSVKMLTASGVATEVYAFDYKAYPELKEAKTGGYTLRVADGDDYGYDASRAWSLSYNYGAQPPSLLSINGVVLTEAETATQTTYADVLYDGEIQYGADHMIALAKGEALNGFTYSAFQGLTSGGYGDFRLMQSKTSKEIVYADGQKFASKTFGDYPISVAHEGYEKSYVVRIGQPVKDTVVASDSLVVGAASSIGGVKGVKITKNSENDRHWYYSLKGTFYGDSSIEYAFADAASMVEGVSFVYSDALGKRLFTIVVAPKSLEENTTANFVGGVYSEKDRGTASEYDVHTLKADGSKATVRLTNDFDRGVSNKGNITAFTELGTGFLPKYGERQSIALSFGKSALSVKMLTASGETAEVYAFDYEAYPELKEAKTGGYTLRVADGDDYGYDASRAWSLVYNYGAQPPSLLSINGVAADATAFPILFEDVTIENKDETKIGDIYYIDIEETQGLSAFHVKAKCSVGGNLIFGEVDDTIDQNGLFSDSQSGMYDYTFIYGSGANAVSKAYKVRINASTPQFRFSEGISCHSTIFMDKNETLRVSPLDVVAEDRKDGVLKNVIVQIKLPGTETFVAYDESFALSDFGIYTIRYSATNSFNVTNSVERTVRYAPSSPKITLDGEVPLLGYVNGKITLPNAQLGAVLTVAKDGDIIDVENNSFVPVEEGEYTVVYSFTDEYDVSAVETFTISVVRDLSAPTIVVAETTEQYKVGDVLNVPSASATDDVDGNVSVSAEIYFDGEKVGGQSVTTERSGIYKIVYTATDRAGNKATKEVQIFVSARETDGALANPDEKKGGCKGEVGNLCVVTTLACAVVAVFAIKKKKQSR